MSDAVEHATSARTGSDANPDPVREFYTRHPYPPPVENLDRARDESGDLLRQRAEFHLFWPGRSYRSDLDILVAGCGTWQAAKYAVGRPDSRVTGIDVSPTSIEHNATLKDQYALSQLDLREWPIERVAELDRRFDLIVCTGVLHHLTDPESGLRALRDVLKPHGVINLMVYAPYGRAGAYMLQEYCRRLGLDDSEAEIRDLVCSLEVLSAQHPLSALLRGSRDARNADAIADALLNPRDRAYSVPQLFDLFDRNGVAFARWHWQAPYLPQCGSIASTPHATRLAAMPARDQFAAAELWRGTMTTHTAIVCRDDAADFGPEVHFVGHEWRQYVPLRRPWARTIEDRLPGGAAAALVNQSHPFTDLVLVLDEQDKRLVDGIDATRGIQEIAEGAQVDPARARALFQKLWRYDQVVFDTSTR